MLLAYRPTIKALIAAPGRIFAQLGLNDRCDVSLDVYPGKSFACRVTRLGVLANDEDGSFDAELEVSNPDGLLLPGMVVEARIFPATLPSSERAGLEERAVLIPSSSLVEVDQNWGVVFLLVDGRAQRKRVRVASIAGDKVVVEAGLQHGDSIVEQGAAWLEDGQRVDVVSRDEMALPAGDASTAINPGIVGSGQ